MNDNELSNLNLLSAKLTKWPNKKLKIKNYFFYFSSYNYFPDWACLPKVTVPNCFSKEFFSKFLEVAEKLAVI